MVASRQNYLTIMTVIADQLEAGISPQRLLGIDVPRLAASAAFFERVAAWLEPGGSFVFNLGSGDDDGEGEASLETDFLGATMLWSSHSRDGTVALLRAAGLELVREEVETVSVGDGVDDAGLKFRFYTCKKPAPDSSK